MDAVPGRAVAAVRGAAPPSRWTARHTAQFLDSIRWHRLYAAYHLIRLRGLRRGEAAGLRWCDVDLDGKTVVISQQLQQYDGRLATTSQIWLRASQSWRFCAGRIVSA
jgi:integrase